MRALLLALPLLIALVAGYQLGQRNKARALLRQQARMLPLATALRNLLDADPRDPRQLRLRRTEADDALTEWMRGERSDLTY